MLKQKLVYTQNDFDGIKRLENFLPDKIFDVHAHMMDTAFTPVAAEPGAERLILGAKEYREEMSIMLGNPKELRINAIVYPDKAMSDLNAGLLQQSDAFLAEQLVAEPDWVGEIVVHPKETAEDIEKRLIHPNIKGLKCYHLLADKEYTFDCNIGEYLPESAWEVANKHKMVITLHMVKQEALANEENQKYICEMAKKYPDAVLILAHAARSFAAWTGIENVDKIAHLENVWFDFSAICETPAMFQIVKKVGIKRCMWGSDYPVCRGRGKCIAIADSFYWIYENDIENFQSKTPVRNWFIGIEGLAAAHQLAVLAELTPTDVEDYFFNNAMRLFYR